LKKPSSQGFADVGARCYSLESNYLLMLEYFKEFFAFLVTPTFHSGKSATALNGSLDCNVYGEPMIISGHT
tara:strand:- start:140 stop:352 length:213 start_codon:yes stop_codon:yes gene_type:complete